jgi:STE24 endopeptidase
MPRAALVTLLLIVGSWKAQAEQPAVDLRAHFSDAEIREFHDFRKPRWLRAFADLGAQSLLLFALVGLRRDRKIYEACERTAKRVRVPQGLQRALDRLWGGDGWLAALLFAVAYFALTLLIDFPQSFAFDYLHLKAHGLSTQTPLRYAGQFVRGAGVMVIGLSLLTFGLWGLARRTPRWWLLLGLPAGALLAAAALLEPAETAVDHRFTELPAGPTRDAVEQVLQRAHVEHAGIFEIDAGRDTRALDAFVLGVGPTRRVALHDTLVRELQPREVAAVVAHELGHLDEPRALRLWLTAAAVLPLLGALAWALRALGRTGRFGFESDRDPVALPAALGLVWIAMTLLTPLSQADSRARELRADRYAVELTRDPEALRTALVKVARANKIDLTPPRAVVLWLYSHPPLAERLAQIAPPSSASIR